MVVHTFIPALRRPSRRISKFQANLVFITSSRLAWATELEQRPCLIPKSQKKKEGRDREIVEGREEEREEHTPSFCFSFPYNLVMVYCGCSGVLVLIPRLRTP